MTTDGIHRNEGGSYAEKTSTDKIKHNIKHNAKEGLQKRGMSRHSLKALKIT
jgi:hypothetical protein